MFDCVFIFVTVLVFTFMSIVRFVCFLYVCMYVCMYVRMYICMCVCVCMYVRMHVPMYVCMYARACTHGACLSLTILDCLVSSVWALSVEHAVIRGNGTN